MEPTAAHHFDPMISPRSDSRASRFFVTSLALCTLLFPVGAHAGTTTNALWTGTGNSDDWNNTSNWADSNQPQGGSANSVINYGTAYGRTNSYNDYGDDNQLEQINFNSSASASYTLNGSRIKVFDVSGNGISGGILNYGSGSQTINFNGSGYSLLLESSAEISPINGDLKINNNVLLDFNNPTINVNGGNNHTLTFSGSIVQNTTAGTVGALSINQNSTVVLNGANTYTGTTNVGAGTLLVNGSTSANSAVTVANGATLGGTGTVAGTIALNGKLSPGTLPTAGSVGTLTTGALTLGSTASTLIDVNGANSFDKVTVSGALTYAGTLTIDLGTYAPTNTTTYQLFTATGLISGAFSNDASIAFDQTGYAGTFDPASGVLTITPVPEPATWFAGILTLGLAGYGLRRRLRLAA